MTTTHNTSGLTTPGDRGMRGAAGNDEPGDEIVSNLRRRAGAVS